MAHKKQNAFTNTAPYTKYLYQTSESFNDEQKCGCEHLKKELGALKEIVLKLEKNFNDSVESHFNREMCFRDAVDLRMREMEEYVRTVLETLEKEVKDCQRRDKQWEEKLEQICPTVLSVTPATITSSKALRSAPATPALNPSTAQPNTSPSGIDNGNPPSTEPETRTIHSTLPFSKEELLEAQADDTAILQLKASCTSSTSQPRGLQVHQGVLYLYRQVQKGNKHLQMLPVIPEALVPLLLCRFHPQTSERHHGRVKTLLRVMEVAWWASIRRDVWQFVSDCHHCRRKGRCGTVRGRQTSRPPYHHHSSKTNTIPTFSTKAGAGRCQEGPHARVTGFNVYQGGSALPVPGYPVWFGVPPLFSVSYASSIYHVPRWEGLVVHNVFQRQFYAHERGNLQYGI